MNLARASAATLLTLAALLPVPGFAQAPPIDRIKVPPGFEVTVFAMNVRDARSMVLGDLNLPGGGGTLFVGTRSAGAVYAIRHDGRKATEVITIASGLKYFLAICCT